MAAKHLPIGLDNRTRDENGQIRQKRSDTRVSTLRTEYGADFAKGHRGDMRLGTLLEKTGAESLHAYLKRRP